MSLSTDIRDVLDRQRALLRDLEALRDRANGDRKAALTRAISLTRHSLKHVRAAR